MSKYRVKLTEGRIIGPFIKEQIVELIAKGKVSENDEIQVFPAGDWKALGKTKLFRNTDKTFLDQTFMKKLDQEENFPQEFDYKKDSAKKVTENKKEETSPPPPLEDIKIEEKIEVIKTEEPIKEIPKEEKKPDVPQELTVQTLKEEAVTDKTVVVKPKQEAATIDKTVINPDAVKEFQQIQAMKEQKKREVEKLKKQEEREKEKERNLKEGATEMIDMREIKYQLRNEVDNAEQELKKEEKKIKKQKKIKEKLEAEANEEDDDESVSKKKLLFIVGGVLLLLVMLFPDDGSKSKKLSFIDPSIQFPVKEEYLDEVGAKKLFENGLKQYRTNSYLNLVKSSKSFRISVEKKFKNNPALGYLVYSYSKLLRFMNSSMLDEVTLFKLIQTTMISSIKDPVYTAGVARFYNHINKETAGIKVVEDYISIKTNKPTLDLFGEYLALLVKNGDFVKSKKVYERLMKAPQKTPRVYESLIEYNLLNQNSAQASELLNQALMTYKDNMVLYMKSLEVGTLESDFTKINKALEVMKSKRYEGSKLYYSKYLEFLGMRLVLENKQPQAVKAFKKSLSYFDSDELRRKLAQVEMGDNSDINQLVSQSKIKDFVSKSEKFLADKNMQEALEYALKATRVDSNSIEAKLNLSRVQMERGYFKEAIKNLERLYNENQQDKDIIFTMLDAYNKAYKFTDTKKILSIVANTELRDDYRYFEKTADYYIAKGSYMSAVQWLRKAINKNPLSDNNTFKLAKIFLDSNKFNEAKLLLSKCIDLDPTNIDYRRAYSRIIYEIDGVRAAIGYLYNVLETFPDDTKILGEIALNYYKSGQIKRYEDVSGKINSLPNKEVNFYVAMYELAKIEDNLEKVIKMLNKIVDISPGLLEYRIELGRYYIADGKYKLALKEFDKVEERLDNYPRLQYYKSQLYMLTDDYDSALKLVNKEIQDNPELIEGYILKGQILTRNKDFIPAEKVFKIAQRIDSKNVEVLKGLAFIGFKKNQYDLALDLYKKAIKIDGSRAELHRLIGDVYRKIGQTKMAIESYKLFLELTTNSRYKSTIENWVKKMQ
jgi:tetratricopeptide (TPR) repeat protein